jgi:hypothetical protein
MIEFTEVTGPRILDDGTNLDLDVVASFPKVKHRQITDPVSDGSLGNYGYAPSQKNLDGTDL